MTWLRQLYKWFLKNTFEFSITFEAECRKRKMVQHKSTECFFWDTAFCLKMAVILLKISSNP